MTREEEALEVFLSLAEEERFIYLARLHAFADTQVPSPVPLEKESETTL